MFPTLLSAESAMNKLTGVSLPPSQSHNLRESGSECRTLYVLELELNEKVVEAKKRS